jgi:hypothetical protein
MSEARCIHDFLAGQCGHCKPPPFGINEVVFTTKGGQVFHNWHDCAFLREGQFLAESRGQDNHPILPTKWSEVFNSNGACEWCCALHHSKGKEMKNCEALIDGKWMQVLHIRERFTNIKHREHQVLLADSGLIYFVTQDEVRF